MSPFNAATSCCVSANGIEAAWTGERVGREPRVPDAVMSSWTRGAQILAGGRRLPGEPSASEQMLDSGIFCP